MKDGYAVVAGDTQLNDKNGAVDLTGIKVFPIDQKTVVGLVGDYGGHLQSIDLLRRRYTQEDGSFVEKTATLYGLLKQYAESFNGIVVTVDDKGVFYSILSDKEEWNSGIVKAKNGEVKVLIPPDVKEEYCYQFITSLTGLKNQAVSCIKAVGKVSNSVNEKVFGAEMTVHEVKYFTDGIKYEDIDVRIA